ncbi:hypothetical protein LMG24076_05065 [Trinickia soli]|uniref:DUF2515 family protein n=1 Tax=Trinickia soli TaxID=380675 RepID=UPI0014689085|nr:hypothetical protein [Trinickia soli]CAB3726078.1 hypothetical protein LMG24076_05065 [Trinickia soli]
MAENLKVTGTTNPDPNTCVDAQCSCEIIWSMAQQFSMRQLVTHAPMHAHLPDYRECNGHVLGEQLEKNWTPKFVSDLEVRAKRIAAAYARVFLEDFHLGDKSKVGRFYWLGLGAFASKQVAATLHTWQVKYVAHCSELRAGLGRGNLWLFNDVLAWFYGYAAGADTFEKCMHARDSRQFVDQVTTNFARQFENDAASIDKVPHEIDGETGLKKAKLGYLKCTQIVKDGFQAVKDWENETGEKRPKIAFAHLLLIAQHEQGEVLQGLIYDDPEFQKWLKLQRGALATSDNMAINASMQTIRSGLSDGSDALVAVTRALVPGLQLVLTPDRTTDDTEFRSDAPDRLVLEDYQKRMEWIKEAAKKYHGLMQRKEKIMFDYLEVIKSWGDLPDL